MIWDDSFVSISEMRDNTSNIFKTLPKTRKRFVMSKNKPIGVVMSIDEYNLSQIPAVEPDQWEIDAINEDLETMDDRWIDAFEFLEKLKKGNV